MALYDPKLVTMILNGINVTHNGDIVCTRSKGGAYIDKQAGAKGDKVTYAKYDQFQTYELTLLFDCPQWLQIQSWAKNHTRLSAQFSDGNTGEKETSTTAYIEELGDIQDGQQRTAKIYFEEVV